MTSGEKRRLNKFLKERGLLKAFNRDKKISRRRTAEINFDGVRIPVIIHKSKGTTIIRHAYDLEVLASSKKYNTNNIFKGFKERQVLRKVNGSLVLTTTSDIRIRRIKRRRFKFFDRIETSFVKKNKVGFVLLNVTFHKGNIKKTVEASSPAPTFLNKKGELDKARGQAFKRCWSQINFSPEKWEINWEHYTYTVQKDRSVRGI